MTSHGHSRDLRRPRWDILRLQRHPFQHFDQEHTNTQRSVIQHHFRSCEGIDMFARCPPRLHWKRRIITHISPQTSKVRPNAVHSVSLRSMLVRFPTCMIYHWMRTVHILQTLFISFPFILPHILYVCQVSIYIYIYIYIYIFAHVAWDVPCDHLYSREREFICNWHYCPQQTWYGVMAEELDAWRCPERGAIKTCCKDKTHSEM